MKLIDKILIAGMSLFIIGMFGAVILLQIDHNKNEKKMDQINTKLDEISSHTDAIDSVLVDMNQDIQEVKKTQDDQSEEWKKELNKVWNSLHKHKEELEEEIESVRVSKQQKKQAQITASVSSGSTSGYTHPFRSQGTADENGYHYTWYSQRKLPGDGLTIPGRHVDDDGFIRDEDGNLCIASRDYTPGSEVDTPYGKGIVYDYCPTSGTLDIYTDW